MKRLCICGFSFEQGIDAPTSRSVNENIEKDPAIHNRELAAPGRWTYTDIAIAPPQQDEFERLSLYHETTGGEAALARKRRDDAIRSSGHADQPAIAEPAQ